MGWWGGKDSNLRRAWPGRFTVCSLCPLGYLPPKIYGYSIGDLQSWRRDSNPRHADYKSAALPTELRQHQEDQAGRQQARSVAK